MSAGPIESYIRCAEVVEHSAASGGGGGRKRGTIVRGPTFEEAVRGSVVALVAAALSGIIPAQARRRSSSSTRSTACAPAVR